jgi:septal ring factor EnvC (AmiA/AmiB activator)
MNLLVAATLLLTCLLMPYRCPAAEIEDPQTYIFNVGKLRQSISGQEEKVDQSSRQERSLLDEVEQLDSTIAKQKAKVKALTLRIREQEQIISANEKEMATIVRKNKDLLNHLMKRLKAFYTMGKTGFLDVIFSSNTLPELLLTNDAFQSLITYDQSLFTTYRESIAAIDRVKRSHELEKGVLENFLADADQENKTLQQAAEEKNILLKQVQMQRGLYQQALKEMKKAENDLTAKLAALRTTDTQQAHDFLLNKGQMPPPVWGQVISQFNETSPVSDDATFSHGITINVPKRSEVIAVYDGEVIFAGYMRGYGKMVIIDHGQQYYTVTARFDELRVKEKDMVTQGQTIGISGDIATLFGKGLYFEVRHESVAENPLDWLQPGTLTIN